MLVRFIEFTFLDGNQWNREKTVSYEEILNNISSVYKPHEVLKIKDAPNDTSKIIKLMGIMDLLEL